MARGRFTKGQITMGLAAELNSAGMNAAVAMTAAMDIMAGLKVPPKWRETLGAEVSDAIDADLRDPTTWRRD